MSFDTYIQLEPIKGESTDEKHKSWIEVFSFSHSVSQHGSGAVSGGSSRVAGKVDVQDFTVTKRVDLSSPYLNKHCCMGKHLDKAVVEVCKSTGQKEVFLKYSFENVVITSVSVGGGQGQEFPVETVTFSFGKVKWDYNHLDNKTGAKVTNMTATHDLVKNVTS
jgi:type VI secretion system secreted protein Hcp